MPILTCRSSISNLQKFSKKAVFWQYLINNLEANPNFAIDMNYKCIMMIFWTNYHNIEWTIWFFNCQNKINIPIFKWNSSCLVYLVSGENDSTWETVFPHKGTILIFCYQIKEYIKIESRRAYVSQYLLVHVICQSLTMWRWQLS